MESLFGIYLAVVILVFLELLGFVISRWMQAARSIWPFVSIAITVAIIGICIFELTFIGVDDLFGILFVIVPILLCIAVTWMSFAYSAMKTVTRNKT